MWIGDLSCGAKATSQRADLQGTKGECCRDFDQLAPPFTECASVFDSKTTTCFLAICAGPPLRASSLQPTSSGGELRFTSGPKAQAIPVSARYRVRTISATCNVGECVTTPGCLFAARNRIAARTDQANCFIDSALNQCQAAYFTKRSWKKLLTLSGLVCNAVMCSVAAACNLSFVRTGTLLRITCFKSAFSRSSGFNSGL